MVCSAPALFAVLQANQAYVDAGLYKS